MSSPLDTDFVDAGHASGDKAPEIRQQDSSAFTSADGDVVDVETIEQFLDQLDEQAGLGDREFERLVSEVDEKRRTFADLLATAPDLDEQEVEFLLRNVFATRQRREEILAETGVETINSAIDDLLRGDGELAARFDAFCEQIEGVDAPVAWSLAAELLHWSDPDAYPLWSRWTWNPGSQTGVVTLVTMNDVDLEGETPGETYELLTDAVDSIADRKAEVGFDADVLSGPMGTDVALATMHAAYTYLVLGMRMTKEFTDAIPDHQEYVRRLLGTQELHERQRGTERHHGRKRQRKEV